LREEKMTNIESPSDKGRIKRIIRRIRIFRRDKEKYEEVQKEENKRTQKDKILDEEEDEEKEEEDEYANYSKMKRQR
jgi:hypothetical protein